MFVYNLCGIIIIISMFTARGGGGGWGVCLCTICAVLLLLLACSQLSPDCGISGLSSQTSRQPTVQ